MIDMGMPKSILIILVLPIVLAFGLTLLAPESSVVEKTDDPQVRACSGKKNAGISPAEDLMREHGLLERILLIYGEIAKRLESGREFPPETLSAAADITRICIEEYHGKLEEEYIFPFFEKAGPKVDLVKVLRDQHAAGRRLTDDIRARANAETLRKPDERKKLSALLFTFIFMYRPHAAREDTVLFPAVRGIVPAEEFDNLRGIFEQRETDLFGAGGFEKQVGHITELEKTLGISDLAQFTPPWGRKKQGK